MKPNNTAKIINRQPQARAACLIAIACFMLLAATFSYAALAGARVIRVTAADITKLPARKNYVADLRQRSVVYDLDGTARAIDWSRVRIREAGGEVALLAYFRERFPKLAGRAPTRLVIGDTGGTMKVLKLEAAPNPGTEYECDADTKNCECIGSEDCSFMLSSKACKDDKAVCEVSAFGLLSCDCAAK